MPVGNVLPLVYPVVSVWVIFTRLQSSDPFGLVYNINGLHEKIESVQLIVGGTVSFGSKFTGQVFIFPLASVDVI